MTKNKQTAKTKKQIMKIEPLQKITAVCSLLAAPIAIGHMITLSQVGDFSEPQTLLTAGTAAATTFRTSLILDMFGYYLLLLPATIFFWLMQKEKRPHHHLIALCGILYITAGATGAALLAWHLPQMIIRHASALPTQQETISAAFEQLLTFIDFRLWNTIGALAGGVWWLGLGWRFPAEHPAWRWGTLILGAGALLNGLGNLLGFSAVASIGLMIYLILATIWPPWLAIRLIRKQHTLPIPSQQT